MALVLVVDDEPLTLELMSTFLRFIGHEAMEALTSRQALEQVRQQTPDAILLDIMLPDINGVELCRQLRADPATAGVPIIMISAIAPPQMRESMEAGANAYLTKPITLQTLKAALIEVGLSSPTAP
jgi:CheY-like chemotaxis protein